MATLREARSILVVATLVMSGCGGVAPRDSQAEPELARSASAILGGAADSTGHQVVEIRRNGQYRCTGLLIAEDLVLTARHCVATTENSASDCGDDAGLMAINRAALDPSTLRVRSETDGGLAVDVAVAEVRVVPGSEGLPTCGRDIGMLRLASRVAGISPAPLRVFAPPSAGESVTVVGYGTQTAPPVPTFGGRFSRADVKVLAVGAGPGLLEAEWSSSEGPCWGDSGGPALDASGASIGIVSHGPDACTTGVYQRLDSWAPWIRGEVQLAATRLGTALPSWAVESVDAGVDAGIEAGTDAGIDARVDAGIDAGFDGGASPRDAGAAPPQLQASSGCSSTSGAVSVLGIPALAALLRRRSRHRRTLQHTGAH